MKDQKWTCNILIWIALFAGLLLIGILTEKFGLLSEDDAHNISASGLRLIVR